MLTARRLSSLPGILVALTAAGLAAAQLVPLDTAAYTRMLASHRGKVVLVDFWATWCPLCAETAPEMKRLYEQYHTNGLEIVGINFDDDTNQALRFIKQNDLPWPQDFAGYGADNKFAQQFGAALPYIWLVDKHGIVQDIHGRKDTEAKIKKLLAQ